jgi:hypothetical protein
MSSRVLPFHLLFSTLVQQCVGHADANNYF